MASVGIDGRLLIWDLEQRRVQHRIDSVFKKGYSVDWDPRGRYLAVGTNDGALVWDIDSWEVVHRHSEGRAVLGVAWSPRGDVLAVMENAEAGRPATIIPVSTEDWTNLDEFETSHVGVFTCKMDWSEDGRLLAFPAALQIGIWDAVEKRQREPLPGHRSSVQAVSFHPSNHRFLASAGRDAEVILWNVDRGEADLRLKGHSHGVAAVEWHPEGEALATSSWDGTCLLYTSDAADDPTLV